MKIKATKLNTFFILAFFCLSILLSGCKKASDYQADSSCETFLACQDATLWDGFDDEGDPFSISFNNNLNNPYDAYLDMGVYGSDCWLRAATIDFGNFSIIENSKNLLKIRNDDDDSTVTFTITNNTLSSYTEESYNGILDSYTLTFTKSSIDVNSLTICDEFNIPKSVFLIHK